MLAIKCKKEIAVKRERERERDRERETQPFVNPDRVDNPVRVDKGPMGSCQQ